VNCRVAESLISPYLDGELSGAQMSQMRRHLSECPGCQREIEEFRALKSLLAVSHDMQADERLHDRMMAGMSARSAKMDQKAWVAGLAAVTSAFALYAAFLTASHINQPVQAEARADNHYNAASDSIYDVGGDPYSNHVQAIAVGLR
jgi:anti-sigma factor RsiW